MNYVESMVEIDSAVPSGQAPELDRLTLPPAVIRPGRQLVEATQIKR